MRDGGSQEILKILQAESESDYAEFHSRLMPTIEREKVIGVRVPKVRALAKRIKNEKIAREFLKELPHEYYEQNNFHAFLIAEIEDFDQCICEVQRFLPHIDNWATCDSLRPKCFKNNTDKLLIFIKEWLNSKHIYTARFGVEMLMTHYLDEHFKPEYLKWVAEIKSDEYYLNMMCAWYFATALSKQWESAIIYFENSILSKEVYKKGIKKAFESYRITKEQKAYLKMLAKNQVNIVAKDTN